MDLKDFIELADRYFRNDLNDQERYLFEKYRRENPIYEKEYLEHISFLEDLKKHSARAEFKIKTSQIISHSNTHKNTFPFLNKLKTLKVNAISAAAIALVASVSTLLMTGYFSSIKKTSTDYRALRREINYVKRNVNAQNNELKNISKEYSKEQTAQYGATGFLLNKNGFAATNYHVVNDADSVFLQNHKGINYKAEVLYKDKETDLAILKIVDDSFETPNKIPYSFNTNDLDLGEDVFTIGYPRDEAVYGTGYLSSKTGYAGDTLAYQISIPINPGNSGGPVFDNKGNIVGIISGKQKGVDGAGFAIKTKTLRDILHCIPPNVFESDIRLNDYNAISGLSRTDKIKKLQEFVYIVRVF